MTEFERLIQEGSKVTLNVTLGDLVSFHNIIMEDAEMKIKAKVDARAEQQLVSREWVRQKLGVCNATLWQWDKRNYLIPIKVGRKVLYNLSDIEKILNRRK